METLTALVAYKLFRPVTALGHVGTTADIQCPNLWS